MMILRKKAAMPAGKWILAAVIDGTSVPAAAAPDRHTVDADHTYPSLEMSYMRIQVEAIRENQSGSRRRSSPLLRVSIAPERRAAPAAP